MSKIIMWLLLGVFVAAVAGCTPPQEGVSEDAVQGLILQFLDKIEWRTSDERRAFVKTHTNDFFGAVDPEKARAQGLVPLSAEDIETLRSAIAKASLTDAEKQSMAAELENDITNRSFTSIFGRVWKWLCNATGDKCSTDDGGSSVGGLADERDVVLAIVAAIYRKPTGLQHQSLASPFDGACRSINLNW